MMKSMKTSISKNSCKNIIILIMALIKARSLTFLQKDTLSIRMEARIPL